MQILRKRISMSETFVSIQGEGKYLGHPSIFVRTSGCNLRCQWDRTKCDTPYTSWDPESNSKTLKCIIDEVNILSMEYPEINEIIITGGEPMIQKNLHLLIDELKTLNYFITLETNGTSAKHLNLDFISISPKLKSSTPTGSNFEKIHEEKRYNKEALLFWFDDYDHQLKFVINLKEDEHEILSILSDLNYRNREKIYLMPQGINSEQLKTNSKLCVDICLRQGWNYSPRSHIDIFGNVRGK